MKKLYDGVQRFCAAHPRFGIPNLMRVIVIGNVAVYVLMLLTQANDANALSFLTFNLNALLHGEVWRLVTFVFVPAYSSPFALLISLYFYYWIGSTLERQWGTAKFNLYYISGALLTVLGLLTAEPMMHLMGTPAEILDDAALYLRIYFLGMIPQMLYNMGANILRAIGDSKRPLYFLIAASLVNIVLDVVFIAVFGWGVMGAALATAVSPVLSIAICSRHFFKKSSTVHLVRQLPSPKLLAQSCQLGVSGFVGEMSSGVTTTVFNLLLLRLAGNVAVAAYGVVANYALVATAIFNGVAQGAQPLVSKCYGKNDAAGTRKLLLLGSGTALALAAALYAVLFGFTGPIVAVFNSENSALMAQYAFSGMRIYFLGYFFAGFNIVAAGYLGAVDRPAEASATSLSRGILAIVACSLVLSALFGMNGVWAAFPASEAITACLTLFLLKRKN